jgi:hypothetical protein
MIVVRDVFRLKFGASREANPLWKEAVEIIRKTGICKDVRLLTDLIGPHFYLVVLEATYDSIAKWEQIHTALQGNAQFAELYKKIMPLTEEGHREMLRTID